MSTDVVTKSLKKVSGGLEGFVARHPFLTGGLILTVAIPLAVLVFEWADWTPSEGIIIQFIASASLVLIAIIPVVYSNRKKHAATANDIQEIKHEVKNDHNTNLRVENDERHVALNDRLDRQDRTLDRILTAIEGQSSDIRGLRRDGGRQDDRIGRLERAVFAVAKGEGHDSDDLAAIENTLTKDEEE